MGFGADLFSNAGPTACYSSAGLAEGTNANTFKIAAPNGAGIDFSIDGLCYHKADTDNIDFSSGHAAQADLTKCLYLIQIDSGGTVSTKKGVEELTADLTAGTRVLHWPTPDDNKCPIGGIKVQNATGSSWTAGSDDLGEASITDVFYNFAGGMPLKPLTS